MSHFINSVPFLRQALTHMEVCVRDSTGLGYPRKVGRGQDARPVDIQLNSGSARTWAEGFTHSWCARVPGPDHRAPQCYTGSATLCAQGSSHSP